MFLHHLPDAELIEQLRAGNDQAFDCLYMRYRDVLVSAAIQRLRDKDLARELVQELMTDVWARRHALQINGSVAAYLHTALRYRILEHIRKLQVKEKLIDEMLAISQQYDHLNPEDQESDLLKMHHFIAALPDRCREVLQLNRFENLSIAAISERLNISENTTKYHLSYAMKLLRESMRSSI